LRDRFLRALVLLGAAVCFITELLSGFDVIRRAPLIVCWLLAAAAAIAIFRKGSHGCKRGTYEYVRHDFFVAACLAACAAILILTAITAAFSPPNSADAMAYHLPRVVYWAEQASVRFFPTHYLNQIMLQPFAEYVMLQSYVISGGDRFINFGQWFASLASIVAVSSIAREWGSTARGQAVAALFCATIPSGILASSGAKNDYVLAMWLAASVYFALRCRKTNRMEDAALLGCALGFALLTKATAYLFAPWPLLAILLVGPRVRSDSLSERQNQPVVISERPAGGPAADQGVRPTFALMLACACALAINAPHYLRNYALSGSILGSDSAFGDQRFRWPDESFGWKQTVSGLLRNASEQLGARSDAWNRGVYNFVLASHRLLGIDPNDPATTWRWTTFAPPTNANHEADAPNRLHLAILFALACLLAWRAIRGRDRERAVYALSLALGFVAFCAYLKWQPFSARLFLPLFVLGAPLVSTIRPLWIQVALCLLLLDGARRPTLENWVRPLRGPHNVLTTPRDDQYFADMTQWRDDWPAYPESVAEIEKTKCDVVGIDIANFQLEYPLLALLRERHPQIRFEHTGVENASKRYRQPVDSPPCAVVCLHCIGDEHRLSLYRDFPKLVPEGRFAIFER